MQMKRYMFHNENSGINSGNLNITQSRRISDRKDLNVLFYRLFLQQPIHLASEIIIEELFL